MAAEVAKLAFQSAKAEAALIPAATPSSGGNASSSQQNLAKLQSDVNARISTLEAQISTLNQQISGARKAQLQDLMAQKERAQGELDLNKAMQQTFEQMSQFMSTNGTSGTGGLEGSINELQSSVPELTTAGSKTGVKPPSTPVAMPASTGLIGEVVQLLRTAQQYAPDQPDDGGNCACEGRGIQTAQPASGHATRHHSARAATGQPKRKRAALGPGAASTA
jgi:TolA-binding protein